MAKVSPTQLATEALSKLAEHEKTCGLRWKEATLELKQINKTVNAHAARWERLSWMVISVVCSGVFLTIVKSWFF